MYSYTEPTNLDTMLSKKLKLIVSFAALLLVVANTNILAQTVEEKVSTLEGKVDGVADRTTELENTVSNLAKLKISGYVQPQWVWTGIDTVGKNGDINNNPQITRSYFQIRRGRVKFTYKSGDIGAVIYPDITEQGVVIKEVYASWDFAHDKGMTMLNLQMGAMNRPFGYEIAYSSSVREVVERSVAENRLFNGERDLGIQIGYTPVFGDLRPVLELGLYNGSDNFAAGPVNDIGGNSGNAFNFGTGQIQGSVSSLTPKSGADSLYIATKVNPAINTTVATGKALVSVNGWKQNQKELIGHVRLPFLLSDEFSFDIGGSWSVGGITPPSDVEATYNDGGTLKLAKSTSGAPHTFTPTTGWEPKGLFLSNRTIFGADAQFYLSVLPFGGTILKAEMYTGKVPFYGSPALIGSGDTATFGMPTAILVQKNVMGYYAMLVQNITDWFQLAVRIESYDPNTNVKGTDFATTALANGPQINGASYLNSKSSFGGDLKLNTITVGLNFFVQGNLRIMLDYDHQTQEEFTKTVAGAIATVGSPNLDKFTARMQVKF